MGEQLEVTPARGEGERSRMKKEARHG